MCEDCKFYDDFTENAGFCRRNAPVAFFIPEKIKPETNEEKSKREQLESVITTWPTVRNNDWCGELEVEPPPYL